MLLKLVTYGWRADCERVVNELVKNEHKLLTYFSVKVCTEPKLKSQLTTFFVALEKAQEQTFSLRLAYLCRKGKEELLKYLSGRNF